MKRIESRTKCVLALALAGMLAIGPAMAEQPSWAGGNKGSDKASSKGSDKGSGKASENERRDSDRPSSHDGDRRGHFEDQHRVAVRNYYDEQYQRGRCPPGLAKKHNGCMPPGQARKWQVGQPLPRDVVYYSVPQPLVVRIGPPPSGYRYVRVASDILLMAVGTRMVVDAIQDLGRQ
jgi:Ni/Co efflux regulator RcnB